MCETAILLDVSSTVQLLVSISLAEMGLINHQADESDWTSHHLHSHHSFTSAHFSPRVIS